MNWKTLLLALVASVFLAPSVFAQDDPELVSDQLLVIEIQLDTLTEIFVSSTGFVKICHVPSGKHVNARVLLVPKQGVRAHLEHGGDSLDYLLPGDSELVKGDWCDPYAGINQE